ncbi:MAG: hypothetical protein ACYS47_15510, partial [Planctomycetota bacterium]|jgi:hypothetical protein
VDETIDTLEKQDRIQEAARLAKRTAREDRAKSLYRICIDRFLKMKRRIQAAEIAEEAGFWREAVQLLRSHGSRSSRLLAAKLAARNEAPRLAAEIYFQEGAPLDALRVAQEAGDMDFVLSHCRISDNPILHHFGAETARKAGQPELGVELLLSNGHLRRAAEFALSAGLMDKARELFERVREERARKSKKAIEGGWCRPGFRRPNYIRRDSESLAAGSEVEES